MEARKNILFLTHRVPFPPNKGDKIRTFHHLDWLSRSHNVHCACFVDNPHDRIHAIALKRWCVEVAALPWSRLEGVVRAFSRWPRGATLTCAAYDDARMRRQLAAWSEAIDFDVVTAFSACMAPYALAVRAKRRVLDLCDVDSEKWLDFARRTSIPTSLLYRAEGRRLRALERALVDKFDATLVITERERALLDAAGRGGVIHVVPNGVDLPASSPPAPSRRGPIICFVGAMDYRPNIEGIEWFVRRAWPSIRGSVPNAKLLIVGRNPAGAVRRLARVPGVIITGEVDDPRKFLAASRLAIAPLFVARGLQNKVLEAMAMRRPVVATQGVADSLGVDSGYHVLVAESAAEFVGQVVGLCREDRRCDELGEAGYRYVAAGHGWTQALALYERLLLGKASPKAYTMLVRTSAQTKSGPILRPIISSRTTSDMI